MLGGADFVLVEGAGGWRVPLNARETFADMPRELGVGVILVVAMRLGCINHALLTAEAIARDGLELAGWVANTPAMPRSPPSGRSAERGNPSISSTAPSAAAATLPISSSAPASGRAAMPLSSRA